MLATFSQFIKSVRESDDGGDYISGNDWTMDHDWANYKDHFNDSGSMDFDIDDPSERIYMDMEGPMPSRRDLARMIEDLKTRIESLETK